ncbi:MAG: class I SAM-dependent methyltransferase [Bacteroidia bacterium]|jgi:SAM-dependent methyltransferase
MTELLRNWYKKQVFNPGLAGIWFNPFFFIRRAIWREVRHFAPQLQGHLLDFGCGSKAYRSLFRVQQYTGLDVEQEGHPHEQEDVDVFYDGRTIPFPDAHFDACFSSEVFEHVFDLPLSIREIYRVLKPGGSGLFVVPFVWDEHEVPYDFGRYSSFGLHHLLKEAGFELVESRKDSHFFLVLIQLWNLYLFNFCPPNKFARLLYTALVISPFTLLGCVLAPFLPRQRSLYFNNVVWVRKPA